jgi:hypothetical protein
MLRSCQRCVGARSMGRRAIVIPLMKHAPVGRREQSMTIGIERTIPASFDCPWTFSSTYRLIVLIWRQLTGQAYCDALSAARTDDDQVNDLTVARSTQRVLQIEDVARTLAVDSND